VNLSRDSNVLVWCTHSCLNNEQSIIRFWN
jgi:hypothetical protein